MPECSQQEHDLAARCHQDYCGHCGQPVVWWCDVEFKKYAPGQAPGGTTHRNGLWAQFCTTCGKPKP